MTSCKRLALSALALLLPLTAAAQVAEAPPPPKPLRFICITPCVDEPFFKQVSEGARDAAALLDVQCEFIGTKDVDLPALASMVHIAIDEGCDGIALNIVDGSAFDGVLAEAQAKGIPVIAFNLNAQPHSRIPTVAQNLYDGGREAAYYAAPLIPRGSQVLITGHDAGASATDARQKGIRDGLADRQLRWQTVVTSGNVDDVEKSIASALRANPAIRAVFATGLSNTEGAGHAIEKYFSGRGYVVIGFDMSPEVARLLRKGAVQLTVDQQAYAQGFYPVVQLAMAKRRGIRPSNFDTGAKVIRAKDLVGGSQEASKPQR